MSLKLRVIPKLDVKSNSLVKGINLEGLRVLGKPEQFAEHYYESGADELYFVDVVFVSSCRTYTVYFNKRKRYNRTQHV